MCNSYKYIYLFRVEKIKIQESLLLAMANGKIVTIDSFQRLIANNSYVYPNELNSAQIFHFVNNSDETISLKSKATTLFVCLDVDLLVASCNESIRGHHREKFQIQCYSHWRANLHGMGECKVFTLRSVSTNKLITIDPNDGLLRVSAYYSA